MKKRNKIWVSVFLFVFLSGNFVVNAVFSDVSGNYKFYEAVNFMEEEGIIDGYPDGTFKANDRINRGEFMKIVVGAIEDNPSGANCFSDIRGEWFAKYVCYAKSEGIVSGYPDNSFRPGDDINLVEALKITLLAFDVELSLSSGGQWFTKYLDTAVENNFLNGLSVNEETLLARGEVAQLIFNVLEGGEVADENGSDNDADENDNDSDDENNDDENDNDDDDSGDSDFQYSWDGSFDADDVNLLRSLFDNEYNGNKVHPEFGTKILPPGQWDWNDGNDDLANYRNFEGAIGVFEPLLDDSGDQYGWELIGNDVSIDFSGPAAYFEGSPGVDIINLGKDGKIHSYVTGNLAAGPDILVFDQSWTLDFRTGSTLSEPSSASQQYSDNDLVIAGCTENSTGAFDIQTTTIHTGPGSDLVFVRDMARAAIDNGNGNGGLTEILDDLDGDDVTVFRGNMADFRYFGGNGDDTAVWYLDDIIQEQLWLYPNFFGGGGSGDAIWGDTGTDRLVLAIPTDTKIITAPATSEGELLIFIPSNYPSEITWDEPVYNDLYARYCIQCGESPQNEKTLIMEYRSANNEVFTGYFFVTDFEELQIGVGNGAKVYDLDDINGKAILNPDADIFEVPTKPNFCS